MEFMGKKIPGYVIGLVLIVLLLLLFVPFVLMPYLSTKPGMDSKHQQAQTTIKLYETKLSGIDNYRGYVNDLTLKWNELEKKMFVSAKDTANDLNKMFRDLGITPASINVSDEAQAVETAQSSTGNPLFSTSISLTFTASQDKLLDVINYFENQSEGSYYISNLSLSTVTQSATDGKTVISSGDLNVSMNISLFYFKDANSQNTQPEAQQ